MIDQYLIKDETGNASSELEAKIASLIEMAAADKRFNDKRSDSELRLLIERHGYDLGLDAATIGLGMGQMIVGAKKLKELQKPKYPDAPKRDSQLASSLAEAQRNASRIRPEVQKVMESINTIAYNKDVAMARNTSGGNAARFGALSQGLSLNRAKQDRMALMQGEQARMAAEARADRLLAERQKESRFMYDADLKRYNNELGFYQQDRQQANALLNNGLDSVMTGLGNWATGLPNMNYYRNELNMNDTRPSMEVPTALPSLDANTLGVQNMNNGVAPASLVQPQYVPYSNLPSREYMPTANPPDRTLMYKMNSDPRAADRYNGMDIGPDNLLPDWLQQYRTY